jgi:putative ABC transport system permease protein
VIAQSWTLAIDRIRANILRSSLTILGVIIGVAAVVGLVSIGAAVEASIDDQFSSLGANSLTVQAGDSAAARVGDTEGGVGNGSFAPDLAIVDSDATLTSEDLDAIAQTPGVEASAPIVQQRVTVAGPSAESTTTVVATTSNLWMIEGWETAAGSFLPERADDGELAVAVLGSSLADELGLEPADAIGTTVTVDGQTYGVIGVLGEVGVSFVPADDSIIVPLANAEGSVIDRDPDFSQIRVLAGEDPEVVSDAVAETLRSTRDVSEDDFSIVEATAIIDTASDVSGTLTMMVTIIGAVSLVVGAIGIANMMLVAVRERSREIGIRRAVGASRAAITGQFLVEAVVLSILGGLIGIAVGAVLAVGLSSTLLDLTATVSEIAVVGALLVSVLVGIAAGIGPAWQAASVDPTVALRYE